jgi:phosphate starvation-inducible PhoH-like protein
VSGLPEDLFVVAEPALLREMCGPGHVNLAELEARLRRFRLTADSQGQGVQLRGEAEGLRLARAALARFSLRLSQGAAPVPEEMARSVREVIDAAAPQINLTGLRKPVSGETLGQRRYLEALRDPNAGLVFGVGPAGTGKTYLAVAAGISELVTRAREKLIIARPAVEAGERLGFLPGDMNEKVDPYLLPIWDALRELIGANEVEALRTRGAIEVAPLAFMRGRTLKDAFVIIDEAQNTTPAQMKMVLTRLGRGSRMVVTGDPTQVDLPPDRRTGRQHSGLAEALDLLEGVEGVRILRLNGEDVVRHDLVGRIIARYEAAFRREQGLEPESDDHGGQLAHMLPDTAPRRLSLAADALTDDVDEEDEDELGDELDDDFEGADGEDASRGGSDAEAAELSVDVAVEDARWSERFTDLEDLVHRALLAAADETEAGDVSVLLADDARLQALNTRWRGKDAPTDVLSWPADERSWPFLGDIALSLDTAERDAREMGKSLEHHVTHLLIHGYLHLLGFDHEAGDAEAEEMEAVERAALESLGIADPYSAASGEED